eukprot:12764813-Ditylum_brightwellii.AAC.1
MCDGVLIVDDNASSTTNIELPGFSDEAYWGELISQSAPVEEPTNPFQKYNLDLTIQRKAFTGKV